MEGRSEPLARELSIQERRRKLAEWYDQYEALAEIMLDSQLMGTLKKGKEWMENFRSEMVCQLAGEVSGRRVLDVGCQYGLFSFYLADRGARVTGMDISRKWVERCRRTAREKYPDRKIEFVVGDAQELPFDSESFDVVVCTEVVEHVDYAGDVLSEIHRVLVPGGVLVLGTPNTASYYVRLWMAIKNLLPMQAIKSVVRKVVKVSQEDIFERVREQLPPDRREEFDREKKRLDELGKELGIEEPGKEEFCEHIREFSNVEMENLLKLMGFQIERRTGFPVFPTYYFLGLRLFIREHFVKVKDNSWWRYHAAPMMYFRAVKRERPAFQPKTRIPQAGD